MSTIKCTICLASLLASETGAHHRLVHLGHAQRYWPCHQCTFRTDRLSDFVVHRLLEGHETRSVFLNLSRGWAKKVDPVLGGTTDWLGKHVDQTANVQSETHSELNDRITREQDREVQEQSITEDLNSVSENLTTGKDTVVTRKKMTPRLDDTLETSLNSKPSRNWEKSTENTGNRDMNLTTPRKERAASKNRCPIVHDITASPTPSTSGNRNPLYSSSDFLETEPSTPKSERKWKSIAVAPLTPASSTKSYQPSVEKGMERDKSRAQGRMPSGLGPQVRCKNCNELRAIPSRKSKAYHTASCLGIRPYSCSICKQRFSQPTQVKKHINGKKMQCAGATIRTNYLLEKECLESVECFDGMPTTQCTICSAHLSTSDSSQHRQRYHTSLFYTCSSCPFIAPEFSDALGHCLLEGHDWATRPKRDCTLSYVICSNKKFKILATKERQMSKPPDIRTKKPTNVASPSPSPRVDLAVDEPVGELWRPYSNDHSTTKGSVQLNSNTKANNLIQKTVDISSGIESVELDVDNEQVESDSEPEILEIEPGTEHIKLELHHSPSDETISNPMLSTLMEDITSLYSESGPSQQTNACARNQSPGHQHADLSTNGGELTLWCSKCKSKVTFALAKNRTPSAISHVKMCCRIRPYSCTSCKYASALERDIISHTKRICWDGRVELVDVEANEAGIRKALEKCFPGQGFDWSGLRA